MRCVMCKNHAHLILGDKELENLPDDAFSWPLFTQEEIQLLYRAYLNNPRRTEREKEVLAGRLSRICTEVRKQKRNPRGRFGGSFLPKSARFHISSVDMGTRPESWFDFVEGKKEIRGQSPRIFFNPTILTLLVLERGAKASRSPVHHPGRARGCNAA